MAIHNYETFESSFWTRFKLKYQMIKRILTNKGVILVTVNHVPKSTLIDVEVKYAGCSTQDVVNACFVAADTLYMVKRGEQSVIDQVKDILK